MKDLFLESYFIWYLIAFELGFVMNKVALNGAVKPNGDLIFPGTSQGNFAVLPSLMLWIATACEVASIVFLILLLFFGEHWWYTLCCFGASMVVRLILQFVPYLNVIESILGIILAPIACVLMFVYLF
jgi:hypothetical protein